MRDPRCIIPGCSDPPARGWKVCELHHKRWARNGHETIQSIDRVQRKPFVKAARVLVERNLNLRSEMEQLLESLPKVKQLDCHCKYTAKSRARAILWNIYNQRGVEEAAISILSMALALEAVPKLTSSPNYSKIQIGHHIASLLRSESFTLFGRTRRVIISAQGWRVKMALFKIVDKIYWPVVGTFKREILKMEGEKHG
jgi:hypothetical protein